MDAIKVKDLMVPLADYVTVSQDATLLDAVMALKEAQDRVDKAQFKHRAVLVYGEDGGIVGKISHINILKGLEPGYKKIGKSQFDHYGISPESIKNMMDEYNLWSDPFEDICQRAMEIKAKDVMHTPADAEYVDVDDSLGEAIHQLVIGQQQSLLVTEKQKVIGILKLTDIFAAVAQALEECD